MKKWLTALAVLGAMVLTGCATNPMAFVKDDEKLTDESPSVYLLTVSQQNNFKVNYQPTFRSIVLESTAPDGSSVRKVFAADEKTYSQGGKSLIRMPLEAGKYKIKFVFSTAGSLFAPGASFHMPINAEFVVTEKGKLYYLGNVNGVIRERKDNEFRAGSLIPLLDQRLAGAAGGTFDVTISDQWEKDMLDFEARIPAIKSLPINKNILPPFDRKLAQEEWEKS